MEAERQRGIAEEKGERRGKRRRLRRVAVGNLSHKREVNPFSHCFSTLATWSERFFRPLGADIADRGGETEANKWKLFLSDVLNPTAWQILFGRDIEVLKSRPISEVSRPEWIEARGQGYLLDIQWWSRCSVGPFREEVSGDKDEEEILGST